MLVVKKVVKKNLPLLIDYKMLTLIPYCKNDNDKLQATLYVNDYLKDNYKKAKFIYKNFKLIGAYLIDGDRLDFMYIERKYRCQKIGTKILNKIKDDFLCMWVLKHNHKALRFFKKNNYEIMETDDDKYILRRVDINDD